MHILYKNVKYERLQICKCIYWDWNASVGANSSNGEDTFGYTKVGQIKGILLD